MSLSKLVAALALGLVMSGSVTPSTLTAPKAQSSPTENSTKSKQIDYDSIADQIWDNVTQKRKDDHVKYFDIAPQGLGYRGTQAVVSLKGKTYTVYARSALDNYDLRDLLVYSDGKLFIDSENNGTCHTAYIVAPDIALTPKGALSTETLNLHIVLGGTPKLEENPTPHYRKALLAIASAYQ